MIEKPLPVDLAFTHLLSLELSKIGLTAIAPIKPHAHRVKLTGGEPTLYPHFEGIVAYLRELTSPFPSPAMTATTAAQAVATS